MKFRRDTEARDPADALDLIRAELLRVVPDLADAERRCDAHPDEETALNEKGIDQCLDGVDPATTERERAEFDRRKIADERERDRLRTVVERLSARGADLAEGLVIEKEQREDEKLNDLKRQRGAAVALIAQLDLAITKNEETRFDLGREKLDARSEFTGRKRDWQFEDQQMVRRLAEQRLSGVAGADPVPARLQARVDAFIAQRRDPVRQADAQRLEKEKLIASGAYVQWPSGDPFPMHLGRLGNRN